MFFRRKRNKSGTYSVIVEDYRDGQKVIIQRIGTSRDELRLRSLERKAQQWIDDQRGPKLPFAIINGFAIFILWQIVIIVFNFF